MTSIRIFTLAALPVALLAHAACSGRLDIDQDQGLLNGTGGTAGGGGGDEDAVEPTTRWMSNPESCPTDRVTPGTPCDVSEGQICAYWTLDSATGSTEYNAYACRAA